MSIVRVNKSNLCLNDGVDCLAEFAQNKDEYSGKLTLVWEKDDVLDKLC